MHARANAHTPRGDANAQVLINFNPSALRVSTLLVLMVCCCHWMGCLWWLVSDLELSYASAPGAPNAWHPDTRALSSGLSSQFATSFFWGAGMVTAMLPYDIEPLTEAEVYTTTLCMFVGLMLNAFVIGSMASALSTMDSKRAVSSAKIETINAYLRIHNVPHDTRAHILEFYEYLYTSSQSMVRVWPRGLWRMRARAHARVRTWTCAFQHPSHAGKHYACEHKRAPDQS